MITLITIWILIFTIVDAVDECVMTDPSDCRLSSLTESTAIYPGNNTRCYFDTKEDGSDNPYFFQVTPGTSSNLIIYFQGGGSCFSSEDCAKGGARRSPEVVDKKGIFDDRGDNPFAGWTAVKILYCTGDLHLGDNIDDDAYFKGRNNVQAVIDWMSSNISDAPEHVIIVGTSAGSVGVHVWANRMLQLANSFQPTPTATVIMDSALGSDNPDFTALIKEAWNLCTEDSLADFGFAADSGLCNEGVTLKDFQMLIQETYPTVPFVFILSKEDPTLFKNFCAIDNSGELCFQGDFYNSMKDVFRGYHDARGNDNNVLTYLINKSLHVVTTNSRLYFPTNFGQWLINPDVWFQSSCIDWLKSIVLRNENFSIQSQCSPWFSFFPPWPFTDYFCDGGISKATFTSSAKGIFRRLGYY